MIKKLLCSVFIVLMCQLVQSVQSVQAKDFYIRPDGGTRDECSGEKNAPLSDSGNCALSHPSWLFPTIGINEDSPVSDGDTVHIERGSYEFGYNAPRWGHDSNCDAAYPYDCKLKPLPDGIRIIGDADNPPVFSATKQLYYLLSLEGSNDVEIENIILTDKSECIRFQHCPDDMFGQTGIRATDSNNVKLTNVTVQGFAVNGIWAGRISDWEMRNLKVLGNGSAGWQGDVGANNSSNSGYIRFIDSDVSYNGMSQDPNDWNRFFNAWGQGQGGYGDGLGTHATGGHWEFINTKFTYNTSDGIDLLYRDTAKDGSVTIIGGQYSSNAGNQIKSSFKTLIDGAAIDGHCGYFARNKNLTWPGNGAWGQGQDCRAGGNTIAINVTGPNQDSVIKNVEIYGEGDVVIEHKNNQCADSSTVSVIDSKIIKGMDFYGGDRSGTYWTNCPEKNTLDLQNTEVMHEGDDDLVDSDPVPDPIPDPQPDPGPVDCPDCECQEQGYVVMTATKFRKKASYDLMMEGKKILVTHKNYPSLFECKRHTQ